MTTGTNDARRRAMNELRNLARYRTHGGYVWAAVMEDCALVCTPCVRENYRQILRATRDGARDGWRCVGITHSGESDQAETCAHCGRVIWEGQV
jgi:hypothetical protein